MSKDRMCAWKYLHSTPGHIMLCRTPTSMASSPLVNVRALCSAQGARGMPAGRCGPLALLHRAGP